MSKQEIEIINIETEMRLALRFIQLSLMLIPKDPKKVLTDIETIIKQLDARIGGI